MRRVVARLVVALTWFLAGGSVRRAKGFTTDPKQRIYFANHSSHLDFVIIWAALPPALRMRTRPVAAKDYWDRSALRRYLARSVFNAVLIERNREAMSANPMDTLKDGLGSEHSLILFPEGTRGDGVTLGPFKSGIYRLALERPDVELIPVYIENLNRILPKGEFLPVPMMSAITFGVPMQVQDGEGKVEFLDRAKNALLELR